MPKKANFIIMKKIIHHVFFGETKAARLIESVIQFLILISVINFTIQTIPNLNPKFIAVLEFIEAISVIIFTLEYLLRFFSSEKRIRFVFSFFGLIDLLAILPFYLSLGMDLRSLRAIRLFRLLRLLKFLRYGETMNKLKESFKNVKNELILFSFATLLLLYFSSVGIYYFENAAQPEAFSSVFSAMWWSVATLTTVGYGDLYPITLGGRIFASIIVFIGLGLVAIPTGLIASSLTQALKKD